MKPADFLGSFLSFFSAQSIADPPAAASHYFNLTAIAAEDGHSVLQCWQLSSPFAITHAPGVQGLAVQQLGAVSNVSYITVPPKFDGSAHNAPGPQLVSFLSGVAHIALPNSDDSVTIHGGAKGVIIVVDTTDVSQEGHITTYPSDSETSALQLPFTDGIIPEHAVLHSGPCLAEEQAGGHESQNVADEL